MQASSLLKSPESLNLTSILPSGVTFTDPQFFNDLSSNVTSSSKVLACRLACLLFSSSYIYELHTLNLTDGSVLHVKPHGLCLLA